VYVYKVGFRQDENGDNWPDIPAGIPFASISDGGPTIIVKTLTEVLGLTPLTRVEAEAEVTAMGFEPRVLDECGIGGEV
jgi:hypothetical protein